MKVNIYRNKNSKIMEYKGLFFAYGDSTEIMDFFLKNKIGDHHTIILSINKNKDSNGYLFTNVSEMDYGVIEDLLTEIKSIDISNRGDAINFLSNFLDFDNQYQFYSIADFINFMSKPRVISDKEYEGKFYFRTTASEYKNKVKIDGYIIYDNDNYSRQGMLYSSNIFTAFTVEKQEAVSRFTLLLKDIIIKFGDKNLYYVYIDSEDSPVTGIEDELNENGFTVAPFAENKKILSYLIDNFSDSDLNYYVLYKYNPGFTRNIAYTN